MAMLSVVNYLAVISSMSLPVSFGGNLDSPMTLKLRVKQSLLTEVTIISLFDQLYSTIL